MINNYKVFETVIASGATLSAELDLGRAYKKVYLDMAGAKAEVRLQGASETGGTYRSILHPIPNTTTVQANAYKIASAISGFIAEIPGGFRFIKVETTAAVADGATFKIHCSD